MGYLFSFRLFLSASEAFVASCCPGSAAPRPALPYRTLPGGARRAAGVRECGVPCRDVGVWLCGEVSAWGKLLAGKVGIHLSKIYLLMCLFFWWLSGDVQFFTSSNPAVPRPARARRKSEGSEIQADCSGLITKGASSVRLPERMDTADTRGGCLNSHRTNTAALAVIKVCFSRVEINHHVSWDYYRELCRSICRISTQTNAFFVWRKLSQFMQLLEKFGGKQQILEFLLFCGCRHGNVELGLSPFYLRSANSVTLQEWCLYHRSIVIC